jgi:hypothetical protein
MEPRTNEVVCPHCKTTYVNDYRFRGKCPACGVKWRFQVIYVDGKTPLEVQRGFSLGSTDAQGRLTQHITIFEDAHGNFIFPDGKPVHDRSYLEQIPEPHREKALAWWVKVNGPIEAPIEEEPPQVPPVEEEPPSGLEQAEPVGEPKEAEEPIEETPII